MLHEPLLNPLKHNKLYKQQLQLRRHEAEKAGDLRQDTGDTRIRKTGDRKEGYRETGEMRQDM